MPPASPLHRLFFRPKHRNACRASATLSWTGDPSRTEQIDSGANKRTHLKLSSSSLSLSLPGSAKPPPILGVSASPSSQSSLLLPYGPYAPPLPLQLPPSTPYSSSSSSSSCPILHRHRSRPAHPRGEPRSTFCAMRPRRSRGSPAERKEGAPAPPAGRAWRGRGACRARRRRAIAASPALGWGGGAVRERETSRWERWETRTRSLRWGEGG